jgi:hypothetical protein
MKKPLGMMLLLAGISWALLSQEVSDKALRVESQEQLMEETEQAHRAIRQAAACTVKGTIRIGQTINSFTTSSSCIAILDSGDTLYVDFYTFSASAGRTYRVSANSALIYLATIQDYSSGTVLASTATCGFMQDACSFIYTIPSAGTYMLGFGSENRTGPYTIGISEIAGATPTPVSTATPLPTVTPHPTRPATTPAPSSSPCGGGRVIPMRGPSQ